LKIKGFKVVFWNRFMVSKDREEKADKVLFLNSFKEK